MNKHNKSLYIFRQEKGAALLLSLMVLTLMIALGAAALSMTTTEYEINASRNTGSQNRLAAESVIEETIVHLEKKLANDQNYYNDKIDVPVRYNPRTSNNYVADIVYKGDFKYQINTIGVQSQPNYQILVRANAIPEEIIPAEGTVTIPEAFTKAIYSMGNVKLVGNANIHGPVHGKIVDPTGNCTIYDGPITYNDKIIKAVSGVPSYQDNVAIPIIDMNYINNATELNKNFGAGDIKDISINYIDGSVNLNGDDLGTKSFLIYSTGDMTITGNFQANVALLTEGNLTVQPDTKIKGILLAKKGIMVKNKSEVTGSIVSLASNGEIKVPGQGEITSDPGLVENLLQRFPFSQMESTNPPTITSYSINGVSIVEWKENQT